LTSVPQNRTARIGVPTRVLPNSLAVASSDNDAALRVSLGIGDIAPACVVPDRDGVLVDLRSDAIAGNPIAIVFCPRLTPSIARLVADYAARHAALTSIGARLFAVTLADAREPEWRNVSFPVLRDADGKVFGAFAANTGDRPTTVVLRPNHHVAAIVKSMPGGAHVDDVFAILKRLAAERKPRLMPPHPPVLVVPDVLTCEECRRLIEVYQTRGNVFMQPGPGIDYNGKDYKMRIPEYGRRDRIDHWIVEEDTKAFLRDRLVNRLFPEIAKAFHYDITAWERMRIGCYEGQRGGELHGHRDNVEPTPYRRFAMSMNLNVEEFSGGELRFPEFGDQRYRPDNGTAFVFSSALLHEALHVTSGRRLVLLAFLFGDR
jgi:peroxiredoxin